MIFVKCIYNIHMHPRTEWENIAETEMTIRELYARYILPMAAIIPLSMIIVLASTNFSLQLADRKWQIPVGLGLLMAVVSYLLNVLIVNVAAVIANLTAPSFLGEKSFIQAMKVATFSQIPYWVAGGVATLIPPLRVLQLLTFYRLYLLYSGLPILMKVPHDNRRSYSLTVLALSVAALLGIGIVVGIPLVAILNSTWRGPLGS